MQPQVLGLGLCLRPAHLQVSHHALRGAKGLHRGRFRHYVKGVLFHLVGALSQYGKLGLTAIASSPEKVDQLYAHTLNVLDKETTLPEGPRRPGPEGVTPRDPV